MLTFTNKAKAQLLIAINMFYAQCRALGPIDLKLENLTTETLPDAPIFQALDHQMVSKRDCNALRNLLTPKLAQARCPDLLELLIAWEGMHALENEKMVTLEQAAALKGLQLNSLRTKLSLRKIPTITVKHRAYLDADALAMI